MSKWQDRRIGSIDCASIDALVSNCIPTLRLKAFATDKEIQAPSSVLIESCQRFSSVPQVTRLGISQYDSGIERSKDDYFRLAQIATKTECAIFTSSLDHLARLRERFLAPGLHAGIMVEPGFGSYFMGSGKMRRGNSPIHVDLAPQNSPGWAIAQCVSQPAWDHDLEIPVGGGEPPVWDRLWQRENDPFQVDDRYFCEPQVMDGADSLSIEVRRGHPAMITSRNLHAVAETENCLAIGSFISEFADYRLRSRC
jgi:hypothetical protein